MGKKNSGKIGELRIKQDAPEKLRIYPQKKQKGDL